MHSRFLSLWLVWLLVSFASLEQLNAQAMRSRVQSSESVSYSLHSNDLSGFGLDIRFPEPSFRKSLLSPSGYFVPVITGCYPANTIGSPNLPAWNRMVELPPGAGYTVTVTNQVWHEIDVPTTFQQMLAEPVQPSVSKSHTGDRPLILDTAVYSANEWFSYELATLSDDGILRDARIARLSIHPMQYHPAAGTIRYLSAATIRVDFHQVDETAMEEMKAVTASPYINAAAFTLNGAEATPTQITAPVHYVILSDPMFQATLQPFIEWKRRKGFIVTEVYRGDPGVGTTPASMKSYLEGIYHGATPSMPAPSFLLIVGDIQQIPSFPQSGIPSKPTDMPYAEYTGDIYPDLLYGRFSATNVAQLQSQIDKTLHVEKYLMSDPSYLEHMVLVAGVDSKHATVWGNGQIHYAATEYVNPNNGLTSHTWYYPSSAGQTTPILQRINQGVSLVNYTAHASATGWQNPAFTNSHVGTMTNTGMYPVVISNACSSNEFQISSCFGETLLRADGRGAVGHIGGANLTYWDEDYYFAVGLGPFMMHPTYAMTGPGFYDRLFHTHGEPYSEWAVTQGAIIHAGNLSVTQSGSNLTPYYWEVYHLMGDPSLMPWLGIPSPVTATMPSALPIGLNQVTINAPPYSYVAITSGGVVHGATVTNSYGTATVNINPINQPQAVEVVITGQNLIPWFDTLHFVMPTGPYVLADSIALKDYTGNINQEIKAGETVHVDVRLRNFTPLSAGPLTLTMVSNDPYITITGPIAQIPGGLAGLDTLSVANAFAFEVAAFVPDQHLVEVAIEVTDNQETWIVHTTFELNAALVHIRSALLRDPSGTAMVSVEPGDPFVFVVDIENTGHAPLQMLPVSLQHNSPYLQLDSSTKTVAVFEPGERYTLSFPGTALNNPIPEGSFVRVTTTAYLNGYTDTLIGYQMLSAVISDFNEGLGDLPWVFQGSQHWHLVPDTPYTGQYCLRSGVIPNQSVTSISITLPVLSRDSISFMYRVSSEEIYDYLSFSVNQIELLRASGFKHDWERASFAVEPGEVTFRWAYEKDHTIVHGHDAAWIDYIIFPPTSIHSSVQEPFTPMELSMYPNPTNGSLTIAMGSTADQGGRVVVYTLDGRMTYQYTFQPGEQQVMLHDGMPISGVYLVVVETPTGRSSRKIVRF